MVKKTAFLFILLFFSLFTGVSAQKTVAAIVKFTGNDTSVSVSRNDNFVVELSVPNRKNYQWAISRPAANCKFTKSQIGEAATMPGAPELQLWFFKATQRGTDSIVFVYKSPYDNAAAVERKLKVIVE
ncbi:MAG TPA: protease inhibitor I42 family protein [Phnomibacter sp.]|nr:protease inhibitor I42 family protein [Phnomibacter sp.]